MKTAILSHSFITTIALYTSIAVLAFALLAPMPARAATVPNLQSLIDQVLTRLEQLSDSYVLTANLYLGASDGNTRGSVSSLQEFLRATGDFTYPDVTGYYGSVTMSAVQQYQCRTLGICTGSPEQNGYGIVGPLTRTSILNAPALLSEPLIGDYGSPMPSTPGRGGSDYEGRPCSFNGKSVKSGSSVTAYKAASVASGSSCVSQTRTCTNGTLSGSYKYASCTVDREISEVPVVPIPGIVKGDDKSRKADLATLQSALEKYYAKKGTYRVPGGGNGGGWGYVNLVEGENYKSSITQGLIDAGVLSKSALKLTGGREYMLYLCNGGQSYSLYARLDNATDAEKNAARGACAGDAVGPETSYARNYTLSSSTEGPWKKKFEGAVTDRFRTSKDSSTLAWGESYVLQGLLNMYEATGDIAYMNRAKTHIDAMFKNAASFPKTQYYGWTTSRYSKDGKAYPYLVHDGMILFPVAKFARLVEDNSNLSSLQTAADSYIKTIEDKHVDVWERAWVQDGNKGYYIATPDLVPSQGVPENKIHPYNQFAAYGRFMLELYRVTGNDEYKEKAVAMGQCIKSALKPAGRYYVWHYADYTTPCAFGTGSYEDSAHANIEVAFMAELGRQGLVFNTSELQRLAYTFTDSVYDSGSAQMRTHVNGGSTLANPNSLYGWLELHTTNSAVTEGAGKILSNTKFKDVTNHAYAATYGAMMKNTR